MKIKKTIKKIADTLISAYGYTTTLQVKKVLRDLYPEQKWFQKDVSKTLMKSDLPFRDNGVFRVYEAADSVPTPSPVSQTLVQSKDPEPEKISKGKMSKLILGSNGRFFNVTYVKKNGKERTLNGRLNSKHPMDEHGYINVLEMKGRGNTVQYRKVNPRKLISLKIDSTSYAVK